MMGIAGALPGVMVLVGIMALLLGIVALLANGIKWARIPNRKVGAGVAGAALVLTMVGGALSGTDGDVSPEALIEEPASAETLQADLASYVGKPCEFDYQVMTQGVASNYCDADSAGALIWVDQDTHERAAAEQTAAREAEAKKVAEAKKKSDEAAAAKARAADAKKAEAEAAAKAKKAAEAKKAEAAAAKAKKAAEAKKAAAAAKAKKAAEDAKTKIRAQEAKPEVQRFTPSTSYANCSAVRAAGAAPIYSGDPGYSRKLDRDGDGVGCE